MRLFLCFSLLCLMAGKAYAFCGFYVAKADTDLFNKASQVVLVRDEDKTVISMMNDYEGELKNFAMVVPVPVVLKKEQVNVGNKKLFERIDAFTAPRLVEYFDEDPCERYAYKSLSRGQEMMVFSAGDARPQGEKSLGVKVEEYFTLGEYDIVVLSAKESDGLETWLRQNDYSIPKGASQALAPYIKQNMKFFIAKVNLEEQAKTGLTYLRPLQFAFNSKKFMLPIRLGMLNAKGPQELFVYVLTKRGRVELTNYRTVKLPSNMDVPLFVKEEFTDFYRAMFDNQVKKQRGKAVWTEYFWDMGWCDPCAADPLTEQELKGLGVFWLDEPEASPSGQSIGSSRPIRRRGGAQPVKVTRLHLRYTKETFPEDLMFHQTEDSQNFQGRYVLRHPWKGSRKKCEEAERYFQSLPQRYEKEAWNLAHLTGWDINEIRKKMKIPSSFKSDKAGSSGDNKKWWERLWKKEK